ncbi:MAG: hypothetical protein H0X31_01375 [Nostocaceae cyanobacterium]|nr:hypothetical protein [Nostocaceae cyanobacterium]
MTLQQAITLLRDLSANHKENRALIQKELGNLRSEGFEVKVALNGRTTALVADVERLLTKLTAVEHMQQATLVQAVTQQPEALEATTEVVTVQADQIKLGLVEEALEGTLEAAFVQTETQELDVRFDGAAMPLETVVEKGFEVAETIHTDEHLVEVTSTESELHPSATRKTLTEIMAQPMPESTVEDEREFAMLEDLFAPREQPTDADKSEATLSDINPSETLLQNSSHLCQKVKSFESIVLVLVILVLVFKAIITVIKAIEESQAATVSAKSFEQMYVAASQNVRHRSKGFVKGFAVA